MAAAAATLSVGSLLLKLLSQVKEVCNTRASNKDVIQELDLFINNLERDLALLRGQTPRHNTSFWAAESLNKDLQKTADYLERCLKQGKFKSFWSAQAIHAKLHTLRDNLVTSFQSTLQIIHFDVAIQGQKQQNEFQETLLRLHQHFLPALEDGITHIRQEMQAMRQERRHMVQIVLEEAATNPSPGNRMDIASAMRQVRSSQPQSDSAEKFFQDVLANLESLWSAGGGSSTSKFEDPITATLMCDPVKGTDGRTYDRWTIIDNGLVRGPYDPSLEDFGIACDDIEVRRSLFEAFPKQEEVFRQRRDEYRRRALSLARRRQYGDAAAKLNHVLQWDRSDQVCRTALADIQRRFPPAPNPSSETSSQSPPRGGRVMAARAALHEVVLDLCRMFLLTLQFLLQVLQFIVACVGEVLKWFWDALCYLRRSEAFRFVIFLFSVASILMATAFSILCQCTQTYSTACSKIGVGPKLHPQPRSGQGTLIFSQGQGGRVSVRMETPAKAGDTDAVLLQANKVCPATEGFYFEVHVGFRAINSKTASVPPGLGFCWRKSAWFSTEESGYLYPESSVFDGGQIWAFSNNFPSEIVSEGDVMGAGTNFYAGTATREIYFTKNGELRLLLRGVKEGIYRPLVRLTPGEVEVNFPHSSFKFNVSQLRDPAWRKSLLGRRYRVDNQPPVLGPLELVGLM